MEHCLGDLRDDTCLPYLNDVIIFSGSFEDHVERLRRVLQRLKENGIKLKLSKCRFSSDKLHFWVEYCLRKAIAWTLITPRQ